MRYAPIPQALFIENRKNFANKLYPESLAVFHSNDIMPTNADGTMPFRQNSDLFYLTGIDQEDTILIICPDAHDKKMREILFIKETNEHVAVWEGKKLTKEEAREISGIQNVQWVSEFEKMFSLLAFESENIYLNTNEHTRAVIQVETRDARFIKYCKEKFPLHNYKRIAPIMHRLRAVKSSWEIFLMKKACQITEKGFRRILNFVKPGVWEYEIEAELIHEFIRNRSRGFAYQPIIASGKNACILHYNANNQQCQDGDLLLLDVGAEYANYASDLSRTIPINGRFTPRQKEVYNAVLRVMRGAKVMLVKGNNLEKYHKEVGKMMESELIGLGLLKKHEVESQDPENPLYKKYFMHGTSHFLGLDVHDVGNKYRIFDTGMVFTCEPGIYIPQEGIGIRLENDILITDNGNIDLMESIPIEAEEIEEIMNSKP